MLFCKILVLFEMIIKKVLNGLVIYCKTQGGQNDQNDWKKEKNTQILQSL